MHGCNDNTRKLELKISGSIFAVKDNYTVYAKNLEYSNVDYLHIDLFQDKKQTNFELEDILKFNEGYLPLDIHLIYHNISDRDIEILNAANAEYLNVQYESLKHKEDIVEIRRKFTGSFGIAITDKTDLKIVDTYIDSLSQILFMCSEPGVSGAKFSEVNYERIKSVKQKYPNLQLFADGGINDEISKKMNELGVQMIVSGSFLAKDIGNMEQRVYSLKYAKEEKIKVTRNMLPLVKLPLIDKDTSFMDVIHTMNRYRMGIVFVMEEGRMSGVITDGDVRRGFIKYQKEIFDVKAEAIMNTQPFWVDSQKNMQQLFSSLAKMHKGIDMIPVMDQGLLVGAVDIHLGY